MDQYRPYRPLLRHSKIAAVVREEEEEERSLIKDLKR